MAGFRGTEMNAELTHLIGDCRVGGLILFSRNILSPRQLCSLCADMQAHAASCGLPPLFIAVDQEGGAVARLRSPFTEFAGSPFMKVAADAERFGDVTGRELKWAGINMNMAPVLDVAPAGFDSVMKDRMFGQDPAHVARMGSIMIRALQKKGVMSIAKHFPGIGRTTLDSHLDQPVLESSLESLETWDIQPFKEALSAHPSGIMFSHVRYPALDPEWPASLSPKVAGLLRKELCYQGLAVTDDLDMGAIVKHYDRKTVIRQIASSSIDIALVCHSVDAVRAISDDLQRHMTNSEKLYALSFSSFQRVIETKQRYCG
jgi:beta-N-acetylhexosaminidase